MYIPSTFFGTQGSCITATTSTTSGTGSVTTGSFISGGFYWQYYQFNNTAITEEANPANYNVNFTIASGSTSQAKLFLVGGGGAGGLGKQTICIVSGEPTAGGGGGGGGIVYYDNFTLAPGTYQVSVGVGGGSPSRPGRQGGNTTFNYTTAYTPFTSSLITAYGGGYGGWVEHYKCNQFDTTILYQGNSGGSAGGNVNSSGTGLGVQTQPCCNGLGGLNGANQGFAGGYGYGFGNTTNGSGGGGAGGEGQAVDQTTQQTPGYGGPGQSWNVTGTSYTYAAGGGAVRAQGFPVINQSSANGAGTAGIGNGGHGSSDYYTHATQGTSGTVIIAWPVCSAAFSCKTFNITGSTSGVSYLPCNLPYVTQNRASSPTDYFSACLLTFSGSNTPVLLTGATTASVGGECGNQSTQSFSCNCTFIRAIAGSGTQTLTYFPCNGSGSVTTTVGTGGSNFCIENLSNAGLTGIGSTITYYGNCKAGTICTGIQYTSSIVNCSSMLATAGVSGGTLTYLPCGASASVALTLSGSESMSICAGFTSSFLSLTGGGSTLQTLGVCYSGSANPTSASVDYLIVGGGAGGGTPYGGGGGAGALFSGSTIITFYPTSSIVYPVVVGNGGAPNQNGFSSSLFLTSSLGGGTGGSNSNGGASGGNGGGGGGFTSGSSSTGSAGGIGTQGFNGGIGAVNLFGNGYAAGGGAGASQNGFNGMETDSGKATGGSGSAWLNGTFYAGGGGGGFNGYAGGPLNTGGRGGGGRGAYNNTIVALAGTGSTGSGGGGGSDILSGASGSNGVVILRYSGSSAKATGGTITYSGSFTYHTFTSSGNFTTFY
jgi:hypothetical protein